MVAINDQPRMEVGVPTQRPGIRLAYLSMSHPPEPPRGSCQAMMDQKDFGFESAPANMRRRDWRKPNNAWNILLMEAGFKPR